ncbi:MAG TPA: CBS domain-containing protein [Planctomycetaceae bacterium]|nr:CBS domain-containing protein [Planctomycetaceae bacterium]
MPKSLTVAQYMVKEVVTVHPEVPAADGILLLLKHGISGMPVVDELGNMVGFLSERDCLKTLVHARYHNLPTTAVRDLMTTEVKTIGPDVGILEVAEIFVNNAFRRLPVIEGGKLVGQISRRDVLRAVEKLH